eukprot:6207750-Pleurochrysis_carterae.AAC.1
MNRSACERQKKDRVLARGQCGNSESNYQDSKFRVEARSHYYVDNNFGSKMFQKRRVILLFQKRFRKCSKKGFDSESPHQQIRMAGAKDVLIA